MTQWTLSRAALLLFFALSSAIAQQTYYIDPAGNDNADGLSPSSAWRTVAKVNASSFAPGDQILFKRGGSWFEQLNPPSAGTSAARITFGAYGTGARPVIDAGGTLDGWNVASNWTSIGSNVWSFNSRRYPGRLWIDGQEYGASGDVTGRGTTTPNARYRWWDDGAGTLRLYAAGNPATTCRDIQVANQGREAMNISGKPYLTFQSMEFRRGQTCIELTGVDHLLIDSCSVLGGTAMYGLWVRGGSDYGEVRNSNFIREDTVLHTFEFCGRQDYNNGQDNIAIQYGSYWDIHDNVIADPGHDAVSISGEPASGTPWISRFNRVHSNEFYMRGDYGRVTSTNGIGDAEYCSDNEIYSNYIHDMRTTSQICGARNKVYYNVVVNQHLIEYFKDQPNHFYFSTAISLSDYGTVDAPYQNAVWNNTFINCDAMGVVVCKGQTFASVKNNIFYNCGLAAGRWTQNVGLGLWGPGCSTDTIQNNIIYSQGGANPVVYQQDMYGATDDIMISVSALNARNGDNGNVISGNIGTDPKLFSNFTFAPSSPAKDAGIPVGLTRDFFNSPVPTNGRPDIGAYEADGRPATAVSQAGPSTAPAAYALDQNYPNPFNPSTVIQFAVPQEGMVTLEVFAITGQRVAQLVNEVRAAGRHAVRFDGGALASGVYFYRLTSAGQAPIIRKMQLLK